MLEGLVEAVNKGYRADSSYKANSWKIALTCIITVAQQPITLRQIKSKHDNHKRDWKVWVELCGLSSWGWDEAKGVPVASEEVIEAYFKAHPKAMKFRNIPPAFLNLLQELFKGVLATGSHAKSINEAIESCIDPKLLSAAALQALGLADEEAEDKEDKEEVEEVSKFKLARSSIKGRQSSSPSTKRPSPPSAPRSSSSTPSQPSLLAMRKRALKQAAREVKSNVKRQRGRRQVAETLEETVEKVTGEMRATRELIAQKSPQEKASAEFINEFSHLDPIEQLAILRAFETKSTARLFLITAGVIELRRSLIDDILASRKEDA